MIPYFILFFVVVIIAIMADKLYKKNKKLSYIFSCGCIIILSLFAAFRSYNVGTDINIYGLRYFNYAGNVNGLKEYFSIDIFGTEYLYYLLNFIVYKTGGTFQLFLFALQLVSSFIVFKIAYEHREDGTFLLYIISYLFLWYNTSLNILRQTLAIFVILYAFKYIESKKYLKYFLFVGIASLFHTSALMCLIMPLIEWFSKRKNKYLYLIIIIAVIFLIYFFIDNIYYVFFLKISLFSRYGNYFAADRETNFKWYFALVKLIMLIGISMFTKKIENEKSNNLLIYLAFLDITLYSSSAFIKYGYRISYYFLPHLILLIPQIDKKLEGSKGKNTYRIFVVILLFVYWITRYVIVHYDGTIPYEFMKGTFF